MDFKAKFIFLLMVLLVLGTAAVSANEINSTDVIALEDDTDSELSTIEVEDNLTSYETDSITADSKNEDIAASTVNKNIQEIKKTNPKLTVKSKSVKSKDTLKISFKNSTNSPLKNKKLTAEINKKKYNIKTDSKGIALLNINLPAKKYKLTVSYKGDKLNNAFSKTFKIKVTKMKTKIIPLTNFVVKKGHLYFYLFDQKLEKVKGEALIFKFNGKKYTKKTNKQGFTRFKINLKESKYSIKAKFKGNKFYTPASKTLKFRVVHSTSFKIGNSKLLDKGFLRVYFKKAHSSVAGKKVTIIIGKKKLSKKFNSEGIAVFKPKVSAKNYVVKAKFGKYVVTKRIVCLEGKVKDPLKENVTFKNGAPDIDVMPGNYVIGDDQATYTLTKSQYKEVLQRDSACLFLNHKLSKYTFFKTKNHPKINHILKRGKWNVIEREINKKLVSVNKRSYWPSQITVSLKGRAYSYSEVRDAQNTGYTCGPTSGSVCSQVLRNYVCESYLSKLAGTNWKYGTKCEGIKKALEKNHFKCTFFYKASFNKALNQLKEGGCALVFHANKHYVAILDISKNGKKVLVSNSYGSYDNIPTKWLKVSYMKTRFSHWEESLVVELNYKLSKKTQNKVNCFYNSMGTKWNRHNPSQTIGYV